MLPENNPEVWCQPGDTAAVSRSPTATNRERLHFGRFAPIRADVPKLMDRNLRVIPVAIEMRRAFCSAFEVTPINPPQLSCAYAERYSRNLVVLLRDLSLRLSKLYKRRPRRI